jgi:hypothetical protein
MRWSTDVAQDVNFNMLPVRLKSEKVDALLAELRAAPDAAFAGKLSWYNAPVSDAKTDTVMPFGVRLEFAGQVLIRESGATYRRLSRKVFELSLESPFEPAVLSHWNAHHGFWTRWTRYCLIEHLYSIAGVVKVFTGSYKKLPVPTISKKKKNVIDRLGAIK